MNISKVNHSTIVEQVMERIRDLIISGQYKVGDRLPTESELAEIFGVGRSTLREAIKIFNYLGILESRAAKGTFVSSRSHISTEALSWSVLLGTDELGNILELRAAIETWSAFRLCEDYATASDDVQAVMASLEEIVNAMYHAVTDEQTIALDFQFHQEIVTYSKNDVFISIYATLKSFTKKITATIHKRFARLSEIAENHMRLLQAIKGGDAYTILQVTRAHMEITRTKLDMDDCETAEAPVDKCDMV